MALWRLPGAGLRHPAHASLHAFAARLAARGGRLGSSAGELVKLHKPFSANFSHTAVHQDAGYVSLNYSAALHAATVHLDEFEPLLRELSASWSCAPAAVPSPGNESGAILSGVTVTIAFMAPRSDASADDVALVVAFLLARLAKPHAMLTWGPSLHDLHHNRANAAPRSRGLWDMASCLPLNASGIEAPYFSVVSSAFVTSSVPGSRAFSLDITLVPTSPLMLFDKVKHNSRFDPDIARSRQRFPEAPLLLDNGTYIVVAPKGSGRKLQSIPYCTGPSPNGGVTYGTIQSICQLVQTGNSLQTGKYYSIAGFDWNYGGRQGVATQSPVALVSGVDASTLGCVSCYAHLALGVYASLDFCNPVGSTICTVDYPNARIYGSVYLREIGAYLEGVVDVMGTLNAVNPSFSSTSTRTLMAKTKVGTLQTVIAGIPIISTGYMGLDATVDLTAQLNVVWSYSASLSGKADVGLVYNYISDYEKRPQAFSNLGGGVYMILNAPAPTVNIPPLTLPYITVGALNVSLSLKPKPSVSLYNMFNVFIEFKPTVTLAISGRQGSCESTRMGYNVNFGLTGIPGYDSVTFESLFGLVMSPASAAQYAPAGNLLTGQTFLPWTIRASAALSQGCSAPLASPSPSPTPSPSPLPTFVLQFTLSMSLASGALTPATVLGFKSQLLSAAAQQLGVTDASVAIVSITDVATGAVFNATGYLLAGGSSGARRAAAAGSAGVSIAMTASVLGSTRYSAAQQAVSSPAFASAIISAASTASSMSASAFTVSAAPQGNQLGASASGGESSSAPVSVALLGGAIGGGFGGLLLIGGIIALCWSRRAAAAKRTTADVSTAVVNNPLGPQQNDLVIRNIKAAPSPAIAEASASASETPQQVSASAPQVVQTMPMASAPASTEVLAEPSPTPDAAEASASVSVAPQQVPAPAPQVVLTMAVALTSAEGQAPRMVVPPMPVT
jgi:hypothetical protein